MCFPLSSDDRCLTGYALSLCEYFQWTVNGVHGRSGQRVVRHVAGENNHGFATVIILLSPGTVPTAPENTRISSPAIISPVLVSLQTHPEGSSVNSAVCNEISKFCTRSYNGGPSKNIWGLNTLLPKLFRKTILWIRENQGTLEIFQFTMGISLIFTDSYQCT